MKKGYFDQQNISCFFPSGIMQANFGGREVIVKSCVLRCVYVFWLGGGGEGYNDVFELFIMLLSMLCRFSVFWDLKSHSEEWRPTHILSQLLLSTQPLELLVRTGSTLVPSENVLLPWSCGREDSACTDDIFRLGIIVSGGDA